jgi:hypothetical protein
MKVILRVGKNEYLVHERIAIVATTVLRSSPRFLYLVALSVFLGSSGLLLMGYLKASELKSATNVSSESMPIIDSGNESIHAAEGEDR